LRSKQEIIDKTKHLIDAAREDFISRRLDRSFKNCINNCFVMARGVGKIHYCKLKNDLVKEGEINKLFICNSDEWACHCEEFECKNDRKSCVEAFNKIICSPSMCGKEFPKLSALLWVLNDGRLNNDLEFKENHGQEENDQKAKGKIRSVIDSLSSWRK
jgi:hypothetical protein